MSNIDYIRVQWVSVGPLMEVYLSEHSTLLTGKIEREKKIVLCQVVLSVKFNGISQGGRVTSKATLNRGIFFFLLK